MDQDCYIKIGGETHVGLEAAKLLAGIRHHDQIEICFRGCSEQDKKLMLAIYQKWREDSDKWKKWRLAVFSALALLVLAVAYLGGYLDGVIQPGKLSQPLPAGPESEFFADQASLYAFMGTIVLILGAIALFVRIQAQKAAKNRGAGLNLRDNEASRRLAKHYLLQLRDEMLVMTPRPR